VTLPAFAIAAIVAALTGPWAMNFIYKDGTHTQGYCTFVQDGAELSGRCGAEATGGQLLLGHIVNEQVTWQVENGPAYHATLDARGSFMTGTFALDGEGQFTATKLK
jgi:hypothetical protein